MGNSLFYRHNNLTNNYLDDIELFNLGYNYCINKNYPKAIEYYLMAIEKGNIKAMNSLGFYYDKVENNYPEAAKYYMMAIEKGNSFAMKNLGNYYNFIEENYPKAIKYYIMAFRNNNNNALKHLKEITTPLKRYKLFTDNDIDYTEPIDKDIQFYKNKLKNTSKLTDCPVCLESKNCVLLNCFAHYICTDCYIELYNKPCPVCRS